MDNLYYKSYIQASSYSIGLWSDMFYNEWKTRMSIYAEKSRLVC
jgi:hypothetical protein